MGTYTTFWLIGCVLAISVGQLLFKVAASTEVAETFFDKLLHPALLLGLLIYGLATVFWIWLLQSTPLSIAYPYMALAFLFVPLLSWFFLSEEIEVSTWIGSAFIIIGVMFHAK